MTTEIIAFIGLDLIGNVQSVNLLQVFAIPVAQRGELVVRLALLRLQAGVCVFRDLLLMLDSLDIDVAVGNEGPLTVKLCVELRVLAFTVVVDGALLIDFGAQSLDEADVCVDARLVVFIHTALFFVQAPKILLHVHQGIL